MNRLPSRRPLGRFTPKVEALEDRSLLTATVVGASIITTAAVYKVLITDDGTAIRVFADNSPAAPLATFAEGTALMVKTNKSGSTNSVTFDMLGGFNSNSLNVNLGVNFGKGSGSLTAQVLSALPTSLGGNSGGQTELPFLSNVNITATSSGGNTNVSLLVGNIESSANLQFSDTGTGKGSNTFFADLIGTPTKSGKEQGTGSTVGLSFQGGDGPNSATVSDTENMDEGSTTNIVLGGKKGTDLFQVFYTGRLLGNLMVTANGGPSNDTITTRFELQSGSTGSLTAAENGGKGNDSLTEVVHKLSTDPATVAATADGGADGSLAKSKDRGTFTQTTATAVGVVFSNLLPANVTFVP